MILRIGCPILIHMATLIEQAQAQAVLEAARATARKRGDVQRVLVSQVWEKLCATGQDEGLSLPDFKDLCLTLHRAGLLNLSRCDLVTDENLPQVRASEVTCGVAQFHLLAV